MTDIEQIQEQYRKMYDAMIRKDEAALASVLDDRFVLVHMTGMRQSKAVFLRAARGYASYGQRRHGGSCWPELCCAAVFGGGEHRWRLQQRITLKKKDGKWLMTEAVASTY